jgi:hypothetical protein
VGVARGGGAALGVQRGRRRADEAAWARRQLSSFPSGAGAHGRYADEPGAPWEVALYKRLAAAGSAPPFPRIAWSRGRLVRTGRGLSGWGRVGGA